MPDKLKCCALDSIIGLDAQEMEKGLLQHKEEERRRMAYEQQIEETKQLNLSFLNTLEIAKCTTPPKKTIKRTPSNQTTPPRSKSARPDTLMSNALEGVMGSGSKFKPKQHEAIKAVLTGCDTILTMPTGAPLHAIES